MNCRLLTQSPRFRWIYPLAGLVLLSGCRGAQPDPPNADQSLPDATKASIERLELRLDQLERRLKEQNPPPPDTADKVPAGPIRSLTLRIGTDDDRLRLYWADGQRSDLLCSQEGQGIWACG